MEASEGVECLVRYGLSGRVAWFAGEDGPDAPARGDAVVARTIRGLELGELLVVEAPRGRAGEDSLGPFRVLRRADDDDQTRAHAADALRGSRFDLCRRIVEEEGWPLELLDVEPLLDLSTVLLVLPLGDDLDPAPIRARFRVTCDFDVHVEPVGDEPVEEPAPSPTASSGRCGDCDCGAGGCSSKAATRTRDDAPAAAGSCATKPRGAGCSSCGVAAWKSKSADARRAASTE